MSQYSRQRYKNSDQRNFKKGCTGKTYHGTVSNARSHCYQLHKKYTNAQAYKCRHCKGFHVTSSALRMGLMCPAHRFTSNSQMHIFLVNRKSGFPATRCKFCAVVLETHNFVLHDTDKAALGSVTTWTSFQAYFIETLKTHSDASIVLSFAQWRLLGFLLSGKPDSRVIAQSARMES